MDKLRGFPCTHSSTINRTKGTMKIGNTVKQIVVLLILLASTGGQTSSQKVVKLPYEIENTIIDVTDPSEYIQGLDRVNISNANITRPIYRKDLDANYIAYYEIEAEGKYIILSAGPETGDYREAESGPSPRPTDTLIGQARKHGQVSHVHFKLHLVFELTVPRVLTNLDSSNKFIFQYRFTTI